MLKRLFKIIFRKQNMMRIYATRKENEVHELTHENFELRAELRNTKIELEQAKKDKILYWNNLSKQKKEKLANDN